MNNMNFTPENIDRILSGKKTVTRRPLKTALGERIHGHFWNVVKISRGDSDKWAKGAIYDLTVEGVDYSFGKVKAAQMRIEHLNEMDAYDAESEGLSSLDEFERIWNLCYADHPEYQWDQNPVVIVIELEVVK